MRLAFVAKDPESQPQGSPTLFDDHLVVFHHYAGNGASIGFTTSTDPGDIELCTSAFEAVWKLAIPHRDYRPA